MPNPKTGTVTMDVAKAVTEIKGGKIEFRVDKHSNLHFIDRQGVVHRARQLVENYAAALDEVLRLKPSAAKGRYLKKATMSARRWAPASRSTRTAPATSCRPRRARPDAEPARTARTTLIDPNTPERPCSGPTDFVRGPRARTLITPKTAGRRSPQGSDRSVRRKRTARAGAVRRTASRRTPPRAPARGFFLCPGHFRRYHWKETHGAGRQGSRRCRDRGELPHLERGRADRVPRTHRGAAEDAAPFAR